MRDVEGLDPNQIITAAVKEYNFPSTSHHLFQHLSYLFLNNVYTFPPRVIKNKITLCKRQEEKSVKFRQCAKCSFLQNQTLAKTPDDLKFGSEVDTCSLYCQIKIIPSHPDSRYWTYLFSTVGFYGQKETEEMRSEYIEKKPQMHQSPAPVVLLEQYSLGHRQQLWVVHA